MQQIKFEQVMRTYSGQAHKCMCGCSGTYKVNSAFRQLADADRGYPHDDSDVSDRSVKLTIGKINAAIRAGNVDEYGEQYVAVVVGNRQYVAYFAAYAQAQQPVALDFQI